MDKKITDLISAPLIKDDDAGVLARNGSDYQFAFSTLVQYIGDSLPVGASINFGINTPQNNEHKNGDIFINTDNGSFFQKVNGIWVLKYQSSTNEKSLVFFDKGLPNTAIGHNDDTYINTDSGVFYQKVGGTWIRVFSMLNGPVGPTGAKGDTGPAGANGTGIINGTVNPSNLSTGVDGDFYVNTLTNTFFGPKKNGDWGVGTPLTAQGWFEVRSTDVGISYDSFGRLSYQNDFLEGRQNYLVEATQLSQKFHTGNDVDIHYDDEAGSFTILAPGFALEPDFSLIIWVSNYVIPPSSGEGGTSPGSGNQIKPTDLSVAIDGQTQFNISTFPTNQSWLNINGIEYFLPEDYTIGAVNGNITLTWLNSFLLSTTDKIKLFKD